MIIDDAKVHDHWNWKYHLQQRERWINMNMPGKHHQWFQIKTTRNNWGIEIFISHNISTTITILWVWPPPSNSDHQDYYITYLVGYSMRFQAKPSFFTFSTVIWEGARPKLYFIIFHSKSLHWHLIPARWNNKSRGCPGSDFFGSNKFLTMLVGCNKRVKVPLSVQWWNHGFSRNIPWTLQNRLHAMTNWKSTSIGKMVVPLGWFPV